MTEQNDKLKAAALAERFRVYSRTTGMNMPISNAEAELIIEVLRKFDRVQNAEQSLEATFANVQAWENRVDKLIDRVLAVYVAASAIASLAHVFFLWSGLLP
jgi:hypothetical protein